MIISSCTSHLLSFLPLPITTANHLLSRLLINRLHRLATVEDYLFAPNKHDGTCLLSQIQQHGSFSNPYFLNKAVSFCAKSRDFDLGIQLHAVVVKLGFVSNVYILSAVVHMYGKCGRIWDCHKLFDEMPARNVVSWNSLIFGYLNVNRPTIAVNLFVEVLRKMVNVTPFSVSGCLLGCSKLEDEELGAQVHGVSVKFGFGNNVVVGTGLVDMYAKLFNVEDSRKLFDRIVDKNVVTWTSMVSGYAQNEQPEEAVVLVREMKRRSIELNYVTYSSLISSFSGSEYLDCCKQIHCCVIREGLESNAHVGTSLVTVYSRCGICLEEFENLCSGHARLDQISWNAVIAGYFNLGCGEQALKCFGEMRQAGIYVDFYTFTSVLGAIGAISSLEDGKKIHCLILKTGYDSNLCVQNGLISVYAKCGAIIDSKKVFWFMKEHDVISWNALLTGCAYHGFGTETVELFEQMRTTGIRPDSTTFLVVLSACSHVGFVDKGLEYFELLKNDVSLQPLKLEHYVSVVDIFGRAGYLDEAEEFVATMPIKPGPSIFKALFHASLIHGNGEVAARCAKNLLELWPNDPGTYVLLANALRTGGNWDGAEDIWKVMGDRGLRKKPGCSWMSNKEGSISFVL